MGLSNQLRGVSADSLPILLVVAVAGWVSYLRSLLFRLRLPSHSAATDTGDLAGDAFSGLAGLVLLADGLAAHRPFPYSPSAAAGDEGCVVCLGGLREGERVRRLSCHHVFHRECLDGWIFAAGEAPGRRGCPLCRSPVGAPAEDHRVGAELFAWLFPY